jgi:hypothetical protein
MKNPNEVSRSAHEGLPWWRHGMVWLVIGGPAVVVVAGITTAVIAVRGADPVLSTEERAAFSDRPAVQGRNHAATGETPR